MTHQESDKGKKSVEVAAPLEDENSQFAVLMKTALKNNSKGERKWPAAYDNTQGGGGEDG